MTSCWFSSHRGWNRVSVAALLGGALIVLSLWIAVLPAGATVTAVTVTATNAKPVITGDAVYLTAAVQGTGDFDHRVTWSLSPVNAGTISPTGLFICSPTFSSSSDVVTVTASSVENPKVGGNAKIDVSFGNAAKHVDLNNSGTEDGSVYHPYRTIQAAINNAANGGTIKVAQGTYSENVNFDWRYGVLLLGGFKGGSATDYAANKPGDFVTRSTDHVNQVTTIQSPAPTLTNAVIGLGTASADTLTYAVDGFTVSGGSNGFDVAGWSAPSLTFFISQNLITNNGVVAAGSGAGLGGGIRARALNVLILDNQITGNRSGVAAGLYVDTETFSFLVQGNVIENNDGGDYYGGGAVLGGKGLFTWNVVRSNRTNLQSDFGYGGGLYLAANPVELSRNIYVNNEAKDEGAGISVDGGANAVMRHELICRNSSTSTGSNGGAALYVGKPATVVIDHCTITGNSCAASPDGNGLKVAEQATARVSNSIIWGNTGNQLSFSGATFTMTYSDSQQNAGTGNISADPLFAEPAADDYHLQSKRGRWNQATSQWVLDALQSPCIDAGQPGSAYALEPRPNGSWANMGVYGNTPEASKSIRNPVIAEVFDLLVGD